MPAGKTFTDKSVDRIAAAVRTIERYPPFSTANEGEDYSNHDRIHRPSFRCSVEYSEADKDFMVYMLPGLAFIYGNANKTKYIKPAAPPVTVPPTPTPAEFSFNWVLNNYIWIKLETSSSGYIWSDPSCDAWADIPTPDDSTLVFLIAQCVAINTATGAEANTETDGTAKDVDQLVCGDIRVFIPYDVYTADYQVTVNADVLGVTVAAGYHITAGKSRTLDVETPFALADGDDKFINRYWNPTTDVWGDLKLEDAAPTEGSVDGDGWCIAEVKRMDYTDSDGNTVHSIDVTQHHIGEMRAWLNAGTIGEFFVGVSHLTIGEPEKDEDGSFKKTWWKVDLMEETAVWADEPAFPLSGGNESFHWGKVSDPWPQHLPRAG